MKIGTQINIKRLPLYEGTIVRTTNVNKNDMENYMN